MFWNILSLLLPVAGYFLGKTLGQGSGGYTGNMGSAIAAGILMIGVILISCLLGATSAIISILRGERFVILSILGLILNLGISLRILVPLFGR